MNILIKHAYEASLILVVSIVVALVVNAVRPDGDIPLIATESYDDKIFKECPDNEKQAESTDSKSMVTQKRGLTIPADTVLVDASEREVFLEGHIPGAVNIPYDDLEPVSDEDLARLMALNKPILVYCNGWVEETDPEKRFPEVTPGSSLADELESRGLKVEYLLRAVETHQSNGGDMETGDRGGAE